MPQKQFESDIAVNKAPPSLHDRRPVRVKYANELLNNRTKKDRIHFPIFSSLMIALPPCGPSNSGVHPERTGRECLVAMASHNTTPKDLR